MNSKHQHFSSFQKKKINKKRITTTTIFAFIQQIFPAILGLGPFYLDILSQKIQKSDSGCGKVERIGI